MQANLWSRLAPARYLLAALLLVELVVTQQRARWQRYDADEYLARVENCRRQQPDVVFVGGSPVSEGIDPQLFHGLDWDGQPARTVYNLGLPGGTTTDVYHAVRRALKQPPRLLVYGISATDLNDSRNEPHGAQVLMTWRDYVTAVQTRPEKTEWLTRQFASGQRDSAWQLYRHRTGIRLWADRQIEDLSPGLTGSGDEIARGLQADDGYRRHGGFSPRAHLREANYQQMKAEGWDGEPFPFMDHYAIGGHLLYLDKLVRWCRERAVELVLVDMPVSADLQTRRNPGEFALYRRTLAECVRRNGLRLIEAGSDNGLSEAEFADLIHLNKHGAAKFAAWLRPRLEESRR